MTAVVCVVCKTTPIPTNSTARSRKMKIWVRMKSRCSIEKKG
jgi:hypothetical protein